MNQLKSALLPYIKPLLPLLYYPRYKNLLQQIEECFQEESDVYCFFPSYQTGGAENVHLQILKALKDKKITTFINYKSRNETHKATFIELSDCFIDFHAAGNHLYFQKRFAATIAARLNKIQNKCTVFGCNSILFYQVIELLNNKNIKVVDLLHAFSPYQEHPIENESIKYVQKIDKRIVINNKTKGDYSTQYAKHGVNSEYLSRIEIIYNPYDKTCYSSGKQFDFPIKCLFVGRGSVEKRIHLYEQIARESKKQNLLYDFTAVGNLENYLSSDYHGYLNFFGEINDVNRLQKIYADHHILVTASTYEGFPMTIVEAMCNGLVNISTDVGGIPEHIIPSHTGFLIQSRSETEIIEDFVRLLKDIQNKRDDLKTISENSIKYVAETFDVKKFNRNYRAAILGINPN